MTKVYLKNILTVMSGTLISQALPVVVIPILVRLYSPADFGVFAIYLSSVAILNVVYTLRFDIAILQPEEEFEAASLLYAAMFSAFAFTIAAFLGVYVFLKFSLIPEKLIDLTSLAYLVPLSALFLSSFNILISWLNRGKEYVLLGKIKVIQSGVTSLLSVMFGLLSLKSAGLVFSFIFGYLLAIAFGVVKTTRPLQKLESARNVAAAVKKYKRYPLIDVPSALLNVSAIQLPAMLLGAFFATTYSGYYHLINRIFIAPITLLSTSVGIVFRQEAKEHFFRDGSYRGIFVYTLKRLFTISSLMLACVLILTPVLSPLVFINEWAGIDKYFKVMVFMYCVKFVASPLSFSFYISNRLHYDFFGQLTYLILVFVAIYIGYFVNDVYSSFLLMSVFGAIIYFGYLWLSFNLSSGEKC